MHFRRERVRIETERHVIEGTLQLPSEGYRSRMTDFLTSHDADFLPITDAELSWLEGGRPAEQHAYLAVSVRHIVLVVELESLGTFDESGEPPAEPLAVVSTPPPPVS
jgi:uncharacterized protein DUF6812